MLIEFYASVTWQCGRCKAYVSVPHTLRQFVDHAGLGMRVDTDFYLKCPECYVHVRLDDPGTDFSVAMENSQEDDE